MGSAGRTFDLVIAAQAWHWVDPAAGPAKAHAALGGSGRLAVFANIYDHEPDTKAALAEIYERLVPETNGRNCLALGRVLDPTGAAFRAALDGSGLFDRAEHRAYEWSRHLTTGEWLDELPTHSDHRVLPAERLAGLLEAVGKAIDDQGGTITVHSTTQLLTARAR